MKNLFIILCFIFIAATLKAQEAHNYAMFGGGLDYSSTRGYTDLERQDDRTAFNFHLNYNFTPFIPISLELQRGTLSGGGDTFALDANLRKYNNNYTALLFRTDVHAGELLGYDIGIFGPLKYLYAGFGFGFVNNNVKTNRIKADGSDYVFPGKDRSTEMLASARIGYSITIYNDYNEPAYVIKLSYTHNFDIGDGLDGYNDPSTRFKNHTTDQYRQITIGFTYNFGPVSSYYKLYR